MGFIIKPHVVSRTSAWRIRWISSTTLLLAGLVVLSIPVPAKSVWWLRLGSSLGTLSFPFPTRLLSVGLIIVTLTVFLSLTWGTLREKMRSVAASSDPDFSWVLWLAIYVFCVVGIHKLINEHSPSDALRLSELSYIAILAFTACSSWCLSAMPPRFWAKWRWANIGQLLGVAGVAALAYGFARHCTPLILANLSGFMGPFQRATLWASADLVRMVVPNPVFEPKEALIGTQNFAVYLDPGCCGWEGMALFAVVFPGYLFAYRHKLHFPQVLILLPIGVVLLWCLNLIRIVVLILLGSWSDSIGVYGFHSVAGWLLLNVATLGVVAASQRFAAFTKEPRSSSHSPADLNPTVPY
ncbi:MAG: hypothetical protein ACREQ4_13345, partial [Candidatus Binataceae bacterium]